MADTAGQAGMSLFEASAVGDLTGMRRVLEEQGAAGTDTDTALCWAALAGQTDAMRLLHTEWGASLPEYAIGLDFHCANVRELLTQWTGPTVKSARKN